MPKLLRESVLKSLDDFFDSIVDERECIHYRASLDPRVTFSELYRNLRFRVHVHLHLRRYPLGELTDYCAVFGYNPITNPSVNDNAIHFHGGTLHKSYPARTYDVDVSDSSGATEKQTEITDNGSYNMDDSMLVGVIYGSEDSERITIRPIRSFVRLEALNNCDVFTRDQSKIAFDFNSIPFLPIDRLVGVTDGELKSTPMPFIVEMNGTQLVDEQVKGRTSVMGKVANNDTHFLAGCDLFRPSDDDMAWWFHVSLNSNGVGLAVDKLINRSLDRIEVLLCPAKLQSWPVEWMHMLYSNHERQDREHSENPQGLRDSGANAQGRIQRLRKGRKARQALNYPPPPEEVAPRTAPSHHRGDYTAKHAHSGSEWHRVSFHLPIGQGPGTVPRVRPVHERNSVSEIQDMPNPSRTDGRMTIYPTPHEPLGVLVIEEDVTPLHAPCQ